MKTERIALFRRTPARIAALLIGSLVVSCGTETSEKTNETNDTADGEATELAESREALSEELMVSLAQAKNFHHKADVHLKDAQLDHAISSVRQILAIPFPSQAPEGEDVLLDARARLAKLLVTSGDLDDAMSVANEGIEVQLTKSRETFFLANLFTVRGHVWEARAQRADEAADTATGKSARRKAVADFDRSITINNAVLKRLTGKANQ